MTAARPKPRGRRPSTPMPVALLLLLLLSLADDRSFSLAFASPPAPSSSSWGLSSLWRAMTRRPTSSRLFAGVEPDEPVPFSSRQMSAVRALEAERPDRLFSDPLSKHFAGEEAMRQAHERASASKASQGVGRKIAVRTRYFDDYLLDSCSDAIQPPPVGPRPRPRRLLRALLRLLSFGRLGQGSNTQRPKIKQVLILGCGMDTRAWRLPLHDTVVVEVDVAPVLRAKEGVLREVQAERAREGLAPIPLTVADRRAVAADFADPDDDWVGRVARVLDVTQPVAVIMEGLLMYIGEKEVGELLERVGRLAAAPGSRVGISLVDWRSVQDAQASSSPLRRTWKWGCDEGKCRGFFEAALSGGGGGSGKRGPREWKVTHVTKVGNAGGYPSGANYDCWRNVGKWRRVGKTLYVLADRVGEKRGGGRRL